MHQIIIIILVLLDDITTLRVQRRKTAAGNARASVAMTERRANSVLRDSSMTLTLMKTNSPVKVGVTL